MNENIKAIIFDMDGVLTDSEPVILEASIIGLREYGVQSQPNDFIPFIGTGEDRFIGGVAEKYGVTYHIGMKKRVYEIYLEIVEKKIGIFPNIPEMLYKLKLNGFLLAIGSSADQIKIDANLKAAGIDIKLFNVVLSANDITHKKPNPEIYLKAADKLGVRPNECIVIEDAINGIIAACAAGMQCIGVETSFSSDELLKAGAMISIKNTKDILNVI